MRLRQIDHLPDLIPIPMLRSAIFFMAFLIAMSGAETGAQETEVESRFEEHFVEFHNRDVKLAGSLLLPERVAPFPAVVFVHGAGRHSRKQHREVGGYYASQGIAALIYDKRGTGESGGGYESHRPYEIWSMTLFPQSPS